MEKNRGSQYGTVSNDQRPHRTEAINIFFRQVKLRRGLPFPVEIPNEETLHAFHDSETGKGLVACKDADDMFAKLGI